jgi:hypothetical protein
MLNPLTIQPPLSDLYKLIDKVPKYPLTNQQLLDFASKIKAPKEVVDFYKSFSDRYIYENKDELAAISEQIGLMRREEADMPKEVERGPEEY